MTRYVESRIKHLANNAHAAQDAHEVYVYLFQEVILPDQMLSNGQ